MGTARRRDSWRARWTAAAGDLAGAAPVEPDHAAGNAGLGQRSAAAVPIAGAATISIVSDLLPARRRAAACRSTGPGFPTNPIQLPPWAGGWQPGIWEHGLSVPDNTLPPAGGGTPPPTQPPGAGAPLPGSDPSGSGWVFAYVPGYGWMWACVAARSRPSRHRPQVTNRPLNRSADLIMTLTRHRLIGCIAAVTLIVSAACTSTSCHPIPVRT